jgi:hypothetical protein
MEVFVVNCEFSYYVCEKCFRACELKEIKNVVSSLATHKQDSSGLNRTNDGAWGLVSLQNKWTALTTNHGELVCA